MVSSRRGGRRVCSGVQASANRRSESSGFVREVSGGWDTLPWIATVQGAGAYGGPQQPGRIRGRNVMSQARHAPDRETSLDVRAARATRGRLRCRIGQAVVGAAAAALLGVSVLTAVPAMADDVDETDPAAESTQPPAPTTESAAPDSSTESSDPAPPAADASGGAATEGSSDEQETPGDDGRAAGRVPSGSTAPKVAAAATGQLTQPASGSSWAAGVAFQVTVSGLEEWYVEVYCGGDYVTEVSHGDPQLTIENPSTTSAMSCSATLYDAGWQYQDDAAFTVRAAAGKPNEIRNLTVNRTTFYPRVADGYRDTVTFGLGNRQGTQLWMYVRNQDGALVRSRRVHGADEWWDGYYRDHVSWNGKTNNGNRVRTGRYRVTFESRGAGFRTARATITVKVATGHRTVRRTVTVDGWYGSRDRVRGNCFATETFYPHGNQLDCWGGRYAQATYNLRVPRNARIVSWFARGYRGCCDNGRVIKTGHRIRPDRYQVRVRVTNWAAFTVTRAGVTYKARVRI
jgi:hypothetical protein